MNSTDTDLISKLLGKDTTFNFVANSIVRYDL